MENQTPQTGFVPAEFYTVDDLDTLKVIADPLRLRIRELMIEPATVKQVAAALDIPPTKLYYHINLLEKHGLIVVVDTRIVSGIIEKHYQVSAKAVRVSSSLFSPTSDESGENINLAIGGLFDDTRADLMASVRAEVVDMSEDAEPHRELFLTSSRLYLDHEQAEEFYQRLGNLLEEYHKISAAQRHNRDSNIIPYKSFCTVFPTSRTQRLPADADVSHDNLPAVEPSPENVDS